MAKSSAQTFDSCQRQYAEMLSELKAGKYAPVYLFHGTEGYFINALEGYITKNALPADQQAFNQVVVYGKDSSGVEVVGAARRYPMLSDKQLVVVRDAQNLRGIEELVHYVSQPQSSTILVIAHREKAMDKRSVLYKKISGMHSAVVFESVAPRDYEVSKFVVGLLAERGRRAEPAAVEMIAENIGANLNRIAREIDKLLTRLPEGGGEGGEGVEGGEGGEGGERAAAGEQGAVITVNDVQENIGISKQFNNFELCKALSFGKFDQALKIAEHLSANPKDNPLLLTISALFTHFSRITAYGFLRFESVQRRTPMPSDMEVSRTLKLPNAYFLKEYVAASGFYPLPKCVAVLGLLRQWDLKSKGMDSGSAVQGELLRDLLLRIAVC